MLLTEPNNQYCIIFLLYKLAFRCGWQLSEFRLKQARIKATYPVKIRKLYIKPTFHLCTYQLVVCLFHAPVKINQPHPVRKQFFCLLLCKLASTLSGCTAEQPAQEVAIQAAATQAIKNQCVVDLEATKTAIDRQTLDKSFVLDEFRCHFIHNLTLATAA